MRKLQYLGVAWLLFYGLQSAAHPSKIFFATQQDSQPNLYDSSAIYISMFQQFKADFERICGITIELVGTKWLAICSDRPFTIGDTNKILVVKNARSYPQYRKAPFTHTVRIKAVNIGQAEISLGDDFGSNNSYAGTIKPVSSECGFIATDNFEVMQQAIDSCQAKGKQRLIMNYDGIAYLVPQFSSRLMPRSYQKTLVINSNLEIRGYNSSRTKLKWGLEDISRVDAGTMPYYAAFWLKNVNFILKKVTLLSPDRGSTNNDHQLIECLHGDADNKTGQNISVDSSAIVSEDGNGFEGWGSGVYMNGSLAINPVDTTIQTITNSFVSAQGGGSYFSPSVGNNLATIGTDTLNRLQRVQNTFIKGGARYTRKASEAEIRLGSDTIIIHDPNFSFYDLTDYEHTRENYREPLLCIIRPTYTGTAQGDTTTVYWTQVNQVINDSTALMDTIARPGQYFTIQSLHTFSTSSNIVTANSGGNFINDLYPGDDLFEDIFGLGYTYIGTVQSIISQTQLILTANANISGSNVYIQTPSTALFVPNPVYSFYGPTLRRHGVRWPVAAGTVYTYRNGGGGYAAFHTLYISGNVGSDNLNSGFQPLRNSGNAQQICNNASFPLCGSCLRRNIGNSLLYDVSWYLAATELKVIIDGPGFGPLTSTYFLYDSPASQKYP